VSFLIFLELHLRGGFECILFSQHEKFEIFFLEFLCGYVMVFIALGYLALFRVLVTLPI
jgi:hypothetical protein